MKPHDPRQRNGRGWLAVMVTLCAAHDSAVWKGVEMPAWIGKVGVRDYRVFRGDQGVAVFVAAHRVGTGSRPTIGSCVAKVDGIVCGKQSAHSAKRSFNSGTILNTRGVFQPRCPNLVDGSNGEIALVVMVWVAMEVTERCGADGLIGENGGLFRKVDQSTRTVTVFLGSFERSKASDCGYENAERELPRIGGKL